MTWYSVLPRPIQHSGGEGEGLQPTGSCYSTRVHSSHRICVVKAAVLDMINLCNKRKLYNCHNNIMHMVGMLYHNGHSCTCTSASPVLPSRLLCNTPQRWIAMYYSISLPVGRTCGVIKKPTGKQWLVTIKNIAFFVMRSITS